MRQKSWFAALHPQSDHRWGIILAGGNGTRLQHFIQSRFGEYRPKQYCALIGKRSMLRHTIDRISELFAADHLFTTINAQHCKWAFEDLHDRLPETVVIQPMNRETGPGILLPLLHVHHEDPEAIVTLFPADHFILDEERYREFVLKAIEHVAEHRDHIVLLGISPTSLQDGYGWIEKGEQLSPHGIFSVKKFWEKPDSSTVRKLHENKCLWNTMNLIGTSHVLLELLEENMNDIFVRSQRIAKSLGTVFEADVTEDVFRKIQPVNFSRNILEQITENLCVLPMDGIYWNDWGVESRILTDIGFLEHRNSMTFREKEHQTAE